MENLTSPVYRTFRRLLTKKKCQDKNYNHCLSCPLAEEVNKVLADGYRAKVYPGRIDIKEGSFPYYDTVYSTLVSGQWNENTFNDILEGQRKGFRIRFTLPVQYLKEGV